MTITEYKKGDVVFLRDTEYRSLFFYGQGGLVYEQSNDNVYDDICLIGELQLEQFEPIVYKDNVIARDDETVVSHISYEKIKTLFGNDLVDLFQKNTKWDVLYKKHLNRSSTSFNMSQASSSMNHLHKRKGLNLDNYKYVSELGVGGFGCVNLVVEKGFKQIEQNEFSPVKKSAFAEENELLMNREEKIISSKNLELETITENKVNSMEDLEDEKVISPSKLSDSNFSVGQIKMPTTSYFALKSIPKKLITSNSMVNNLKCERDIMSYVDFGFICSGRKSGKDDTYIHFLTDFVDGMPFDDVLMELDELTDEQSIFYFAQIIFILEYLHYNGIIYRDLKPQNLVCDTKGYVNLVDFGISKFLKKGDRTFTIVGSPHYTAPEVIKSTGYGFEADYWSLGII